MSKTTPSTNPISDSTDLLDKIIDSVYFDGEYSRDDFYEAFEQLLHRERLKARIDEQSRRLTLNVGSIYTSKQYANGFNDAIDAVDKAKDIRIIELKSQLEKDQE